MAADHAARLLNVAKTLQNYDNAVYEGKEFRGEIDELEAVAAALSPKWTTVKPTEPGYYWARWRVSGTEHRADISQLVRRNDDGVLVLKEEGQGLWECAPVADLRVDLEWSGPIPCPEVKP